MSLFAPASRKIMITNFSLGGTGTSPSSAPASSVHQPPTAQTGPPAQDKWTWLLGEDCLGREGGCFVWGSSQRPWNAGSPGPVLWRARKQGPRSLSACLLPLAFNERYPPLPHIQISASAFLRIWKPSLKGVRQLAKVSQLPPSISSAWGAKELEE